MKKMGSTCSMQRQQHMGETSGSRSRSKSFDGTGGARSSQRHSVICAIPDQCIAKLFPKEDNYVNEPGGKRSPQSLSKLCVDAVCRSLPDLSSELPPGLPQEVVDDVVKSLLQHSALNATTLRVLRNCEFFQLSLAGCRGVTDAWLEPLASFCSPTSTPTSSPRLLASSGMDDIEDMDLDKKETEDKPSDIFYGTFQSHRKDDGSACSSSSFVSASSNPSASENCKIEDSKIRSYSSLSSFTSNLTLLDFRGSQGLTDRGIMQLTNLGSLEVVRLDNCHSMTGRGLLALARSYRLHTLSLANCRRLTDEAVINISHLSSLKTLSLDGCRCLTDRSLAALSDLFALQKLDLSQCDLITDESIKYLDHLDSLEELSLGWCRLITDDGVKILTRNPERGRCLRILRLARCSISDVGVGYLASLQSLEELDLNGCNEVRSSALANSLEQLTRLIVLDVSYCPGILRSSWQGKIRNLKTLDLSYSGVKDSHLCKLMNLAALEELNLDSCHISDSAIAHLADHNVVPNLTSLDLADNPITDVGMTKISMFTKLTRLSLFYCNITNGGLRHISKLTALEILNLDSREISDEGLVFLRNLSRLKSLDIFSGRITDSGCVSIARITSLESLELCGGGVGDFGCTLLASLVNLTSLNLSQNERITNRGAAALAVLKNLKALNLSNTRVNSSALKYLSGLLKLQSLALYGCRGINNEQALGKLHHGLPNLKCIRLNTGSDDDGMVVLGHDESVDDDDNDSAFWAEAAVADMEEDTSIYSNHD